jgi:hypothetical protein
VLGEKVGLNVGNCVGTFTNRSEDIEYKALPKPSPQSSPLEHFIAAQLQSILPHMSRLKSH